MDEKITKIVEYHRHIDEAEIVGDWATVRRLIVDLYHFCSEKTE